MTLEESKLILPMMEEMIQTLEEQQTLVSDLYQQLTETNEQLLTMQEQNQSLLELNRQYKELLNDLPASEEMLQTMEQLTNENTDLTKSRDDWMNLAEKLSAENQKLKEQNNSLQTLIASYRNGGN